MGTIIEKKVLYVILRLYPENKKEVEVWEQIDGTCGSYYNKPEMLNVIAELTEIVNQMEE